MTASKPKSEGSFCLPTYYGKKRFPVKTETFILLGVVEVVFPNVVQTRRYIFRNKTNIQFKPVFSNIKISLELSNYYAPGKIAVL